MIPRFDPGKALEIIERDKVTIFQGVPTMYHAMLNHDGREDADVSSLRACMSGGSAMPVEVMKDFEEAFGCEVLEGYGLSRDRRRSRRSTTPARSASPARSAPRSRASR